jgi:long-subunit acyl-CoA synthetase (AMP-forming)
MDRAQPRGHVERARGLHGGEAIGPEIFEFWRSLGINLKQLYGQTEASVFITQQPDGGVRADTVGVPTPGVEVRIGENGEVYYRSPGTFVEYYKNADATRDTKDPEGWVATGDAGISRRKAASCASSTAPRTWARWPTDGSSRPNTSRTS